MEGHYAPTPLLPVVPAHEITTSEAHRVSDHQTHTNLIAEYGSAQCVLRSQHTHKVQAAGARREAQGGLLGVQLASP